MCSEKQHKCYCGVDYSCNYPDFACPTINGDEDGHMCNYCFNNWADDYSMDWAYEDEYIEDEDFSDE